MTFYQDHSILFGIICLIAVIALIVWLETKPDKDMQGVIRARCPYNNDNYDKEFYRVINCKPCEKMCGITYNICYRWDICDLERGRRERVG